MDEKAELGGVIKEDLSRPGTHVLVIGVSRYLHGVDANAPGRLGVEMRIGNLTSAARSAATIADWLLGRVMLPPLPPLASLRVLLSPVARELDDAPIDARLRAVPRATRANVQEAMRQFRISCESHRDNHAVVYVAGHGIQVTRTGAVLLLEDFGADTDPMKLYAAIDIEAHRRGLEHDGAAKQQCWFADICRERPEIASKYQNLPTGVPCDEPDDGGVDASPMVLATTGGAWAYGFKNGRSFFCEALLWALRDGGAATAAADSWQVPFTALYGKLHARVDEIARRHGYEQRVQLGGNCSPGVFHVYDSSPQVDVTIVLQPEAAPKSSRLRLRDDSSVVVHECADCWPAKARVDAGIYSVEVVDTAPYANFFKSMLFDPSTPPYTVTLR